MIWSAVQMTKIPTVEPAFTVNNTARERLPHRDPYAIPLTISNLLSYIIALTLSPHHQKLLAFRGGLKAAVSL